MVVARSQRGCGNIGCSQWSHVGCSQVTGYDWGIVDDDWCVSNISIWESSGSNSGVGWVSIVDISARVQRLVDVSGSVSECRCLAVDCSGNQWLFCLSDDLVCWNIRSPNRIIGSSYVVDSNWNIRRGSQSWCCNRTSRLSNDRVGWVSRLPNNFWLLNRNITWGSKRFWDCFIPNDNNWIADEGGWCSSCWIQNFCSSNLGSNFSLLVDWSFWDNDWLWNLVYQITVFLLSKCPLIDELLISHLLSKLVELRKIKLEKFFFSQICVFLEKSHFTKKRPKDPLLN